MQVNQLNMLIHNMWYHHKYITARGILQISIVRTTETDWFYLIDNLEVVIYYSSVDGGGE